MKIANIIAYVLVIVGAINWGRFGLLNFNLVSFVFGGARVMGSVVIYSIIAAAALWLIISPFLTEGKLALTRGEDI